MLQYKYIRPLRPLVITTVLLLLGPFCSHATQSHYTLTDFYRLAIQQAEKIAIAQEDVTQAELTRQKALAVMIPELSAISRYRLYSEEKTSSGALVQPSWDGSWGLTLEQEFTLNGRELTGLKIAMDGIAKSHHDLNAVKEAYLLTVAEAYYGAVKARKNIDIATANVQRLGKHRDAVQIRLKLGEVAKTELFRTEAELARADTIEIRAHNALRFNRAVLARVTGLDTAFNIAPPDLHAAPPAATDPAHLKKEALRHRAEMQSHRTAEKMAGDMVRYNQGAYWPTINLEGGWMNMEQDPTPVNDESLFVGLRFEFPLFDGGQRRAVVREARSLQRQTALARQDTARQIAIEVEQAWLDLDTQRSVLASLQSELRYAGENFSAVTRLFEHGMANSVDVMDANTLLLTSERQLSEAQYNLLLAALKLKRAEGTLLTDVEQQLRTTETPADRALEK